MGPARPARPGWGRLRKNWPALGQRHWVLTPRVWVAGTLAWWRSRSSAPAGVMLLIITGVIGGLIRFGIIGLSIGPVILAVTFTLLHAWISRGQSPAPTKMNTENAQLI
jgi:hypothetical protein